MTSRISTLPERPSLFSAISLPILNNAVRDLSFLFSRGYAEGAALELVGDRYQLVNPQRIAVRRASCSEQSLAGRHLAELDSSEVSGKTVYLDGFNVLITIECALTGRLVFRCRDGAVRDIAGVHANYRRIAQTMAAAQWIHRTLGGLAVAAAVWYFDRPISKSGELAQLIQNDGVASGLPVRTELHYNPDKMLMAAEDPICTSDGYVLDHCGQWFNLVAYMMDNCHDTDLEIVDLQGKH